MHQTYVPQRTGHLVDVGWDLLGALGGAPLTSSGALEMMTPLRFRAPSRPNSTPTCASPRAIGP
ncbi:MAG: hypothetical protein ACXWLF_06875 [Myxococcaceae bacterium]